MKNIINLALNDMYFKNKKEQIINCEAVKIKKRSAFSSLRRKLSLLGFEPKNSVFKIDEVKDESNNFFPEQS